MIDQLKQHEKTFAKFVEWMKNQKKYLDDKNRFYWRYECGKASTLYELVYHSIYLTNRELLSLLVEFCDSEGMCIEISTHLTGGECLFSYSVWNVKEITKSLVNDSFISTRTEATKQAIVKIFELMESER